MQRNIVVTGGTGALGQAVVREILAREPEAHVYVPMFRALEGMQAGFLDKQGNSIFERERLHLVSHELSLDMRDEERVSGFFAMLPRLHASAHLLGGFAMNPLEATSAAEVRSMFELNAITAFLSCREAVKKMDKGGHLLNVIAKPALLPSAGMTAYAMSKAAVAALTTCLAEELKDRCIWVNAIAPSIMNTPANRHSMPNADTSTWPTVEEVARTIYFLISEQNCVVRGALVPVFGAT